MIVADNNALNSYLRIPPYFGTGREAPLVFEVTAPRRVPDTLQDRGNEHERDAAERHTPLAPSPRQALAKSTSSAHREDPVDSDYHPLTQLQWAPQGQSELDSQMSLTVRIRASLARSGHLPEQMVTAGGHLFDTPVQAHATLIAARVHALGTTTSTPL